MTPRHDTFQDWLEDAVRQWADGADSSHDLHHARRVWRNCQAISAGESMPCDPIVLMAAAYLHDLVNLPKNSLKRAEASKLSAAKACDLLGIYGMANGELDRVAHAIEAHSFSAGIAPQSIEARILQDADRLESLGTLGVARTFYVAGRMGGALFDGDDPFATRREMDDHAYALDHFFTKLLKLPSSFQTGTGRKLARRRAAVTARFALDLAEELNLASTLVPELALAAVAVQEQPS